MKLSARNQIKGTVLKVADGAVNGIVKIGFADTAISAVITMAAIQELGLEEGKEAIAVIKATEVMIGIGEMTLSARNKLPGVIESVEKGAVNGVVKIKVAGDNVISATISIAAIEQLGLEAGKEAVAVIKATSVMIGVED